MKVITICGTRPEFLRLIPTIRKLYKYFDHKIIWTNQNFEDCLSTQFFEEFKIKPDYFVENKEKCVGIDYISFVMPKIREVLEKEKPDKILVLGDTNSVLSAVLVAKKMGITIFHTEAGNRCYRPDVTPEEINRYIIDSIADWHLCYTQRAREQLLLEGKRPDRVIVVGNPIAELIYEIPLCESEPDITEKYYLSTIHRKENIEEKKRLKEIIKSLSFLKHKVKLSGHPSLISKLKKYKIKLNKNIELFEPCNFKDFLNLEFNAVAMVSDSGTAPEENHLLFKPCVLLRLSTERPELLESNDMIVCSEPRELKTALKIAEGELEDNIDIPEYHGLFSSIVVKILMRD